ncbi:LysM peptidoglycan-binding domain-containing protein [Saccharopolyspora sp. TS4A08]|uniref:LysM peptidoglycan-binding domain-containing protein n=1 Tax=Saccharopolyspora ipomoeae TaxID=3042027 RepID=A0ABT6PSH6_9PSEU|nr:LysM peptidoglycan-binding domain-containing protein [Saccharopolyspora sp. TS4A08]MDI2030955.1 LysM peptidoglycan-binding domain-containing protein [Saccharopolyspora sp. TS4A08]
MTTFIDTVRRVRPVERESLAVRPEVEPIVSPRRRAEERRPHGRVIQAAGRGRVGEVRSCARPLRAIGRAGEWLVLGGVAAATFLVVVLVGLFGVGDAPVTGGTTVVQVRTGDTLWGIATRMAPDEDPRAVVERIVELNGLGGASAEAGRHLVVPVGS